MYIPKRYQGGDRDQALAFMQRFNFATIVSNKDSLPIATHLPFVASRQNDGIILSGHFATANEQWQDIELGQVLVIFSEPHAYISPTHYEKEQNEPTWNHLVVHAYGKVRLIEDINSVMALLEEMMSIFEPAYRRQWNQLDNAYKLRMDSTSFDPSKPAKMKIKN